MTVIKYNCFATKGVESIIECGLNEKQKIAFIRKYEKLKYNITFEELKSNK